ncbi:MAG: hypothetical protein ABGY09_07075 [Euryarchaeota archaeon]
MVLTECPGLWARSLPAAVIEWVGTAERLHGRAWVPGQGRK